MDLRLFFDKLSEDDVAHYKRLRGFGENVHFLLGELPDLNNTDIAFFTVGKSFEGEEVKETYTEGYKSFHQLRSALYALQSFNKPLQIVDLGQLRPGAHIEETKGRLTEICAYLMSMDVLPLAIACDHALDMGQFLAYQELDKLVSVLVVDAKIDMHLHTETQRKKREKEHDTAEKDGSSQSQEGLSQEAQTRAGQAQAGRTQVGDTQVGHTQEMLLHHPNFLFDYCHLGYQRYFVNKKVLDTFIKLNFEMKSIGQMRDNLQEIEPLLRGADMLSFDLSAIKHSDLPLKNTVQPFGLSGEEACQLSWYAGTNEKLTSVGLYGLSEENCDSDLAMQVVSTMLWYFIEGFAHRKVEYSFKSNFHIKYIVPLIDSNKNLPTHELIFYKSKQTDKWWMEIPTSSDKSNILGRNAIVPCSYSDYETANKGVVPDRWLKALEKFS